MHETISFFSDFCSVMLCLAGIKTVFFRNRLSVTGL